MLRQSEKEFHGPDLKEDITVENLILGQPSGESQDSFRRWLEKRI